MIKRILIPKAEAFDSSSHCLINLYHQNANLDKTINVLCDTALIGSNGIIRGLGKPDYICAETENRQGVWGFVGGRGTRFVIFSDGYNKSGYKGSSIEIQQPEGELDLDMVAEDVNELIAYLCTASDYYGYDERSIEMVKNYFKC